MHEKSSYNSESRKRGLKKTMGLQLTVRCFEFSLVSNVTTQEGSGKFFRNKKQRDVLINKKMLRINFFHILFISRVLAVM